MPDTQTLIIYGASDDLAEFEGYMRGEVGCYDSEVVVLIGDGNRALGVVLKHDGQRGWILGVFMPDDIEDDNWSPWPAVLGNEGYSPKISIEVVPGAPVKCWVDDVERPIQ